jgi:hypothetical protein
MTAYPNPSILQTLQYKLPHFQKRSKKKLANIARWVFGNLVQASYFERRAILANFFLLLF